MNALNDLSTEVRFRERMRGYDFEEVDSYVKAVSRAVAQGRDQISDLQQRLAQAEPNGGNGDGLSETREMLLRTLVLAQRTADTAIAEA
ncbi:MAG: DivIVA domain-containing protein, partial [Acidimicrobiaceae bacterium]|nr:DivIVA domain-containing protein [Acidimicrobiaceae bacterium]